MATWHKTSGPCARSLIALEVLERLGPCVDDGDLGDVLLHDLLDLIHGRGRFTTLEAMMLQQVAVLVLQVVDRLLFFFVFNFCFFIFVYFFASRRAP